MLELTHHSLIGEVKVAIEKTREPLRRVEKMILKRKGGTGLEGSNRENYYHRWLTFVVPQLVWGVPQVVFEDSADPDYAQEVKECEAVTNQWGNDLRIDDFLRDGPATDMQYNYGIGYMDVRPVQWDDQGAHEPYPERVPQTRYFEDSMAMGRGEVRFQGHTFAIDRNDAKEEDGWNQELIEAYGSDAHLDLLGRDEDLHGNVKRKELVFHEVWIPEAEPTDEQIKEWGSDAPEGEGFNGWIFTLYATASEEDADGKSHDFTVGDELAKDTYRDWPRPPRPYYGPGCGPYFIFGAYSGTNHSLPVGPLEACEAEIIAANMVSEVVERGAKSYKRLIGLPAKAGDDDVKIIRDEDHDNVVRFEGLVRPDEVVHAEIGGITDQMLATKTEHRETVEQNLGLSDLHTGMAPRTGNTATADSIADSAASVRFAGIEQGFHRGVEKMYYIAAWYFWNDDRCHRRLSPKSIEELGLDLESARYWPPTSDTAKQLRTVYGVEGDPPMFEALSLRLNPYSIKRTSESVQQFRAMQGMNIILQVLPSMMQAPQAPWDDLLEQWGDQLNIPGLGEFARKFVATVPPEGMLSPHPMGQGMPTMAEPGTGPGPRMMTA